MAAVGFRWRWLSSPTRSSFHSGGGAYIRATTYAVRISRSVGATDKVQPGISRATPNPAASKYAAISSRSSARADSSPRVLTTAPDATPASTASPIKPARSRAFRTNGIDRALESTVNSSVGACTRSSDSGAHPMESGSKRLATSAAVWRSVASIGHGYSPERHSVRVKPTTAPSPMTRSVALCVCVIHRSSARWADPASVLIPIRYGRLGRQATLLPVRDGPVPPWSGCWSRVSPPSAGQSPTASRVRDC